MAYLLFPGRHILNTRFQQEYLFKVLKSPKTKVLEPDNCKVSGKIEKIIFAITSANHPTSRYNPIQFEHRLQAVTRFAEAISVKTGIESAIIGIPHVAPTENFASFTLRAVRDVSDGLLDLNPSNTFVLCSTPSVISLYEELGFAILPAELNSNRIIVHKTPFQIFDTMVHMKHPIKSTIVRNLIADTTRSLWESQPWIFESARRIFSESILTEEGSFTSTRNYDTYALGMGNEEIVLVKYSDIQRFIKSGIIVDEGCADGALLEMVARDFPDSDLHGIELSAEFTARLKERQRQGKYGKSYVFFHQRNILDNFFKPGTVDTTIANSTVHELFSYMDGVLSVKSYYANKYAQIAAGGRYIERDVVGPEDKNRIILLWLNEDDGKNDNVHKKCPDPKSLASHIGGLSTRGRFERFAHDFLDARRKAGEKSRTPVSYDIVKRGKKTYFRTSLKNAAEFMLTKEYVDNWESEMNEEFTFRSFSEAKQLLAQAGFFVIEDALHPENGSHVYTSKYVVDNWWKGKVELYVEENGSLAPFPYPPTNMVLVGEKR